MEFLFQPQTPPSTQRKRAPSTSYTGGTAHTDGSIPTALFLYSASKSRYGQSSSSSSNHYNSVNYLVDSICKKRGNEDETQRSRKKQCLPEQSIVTDNNQAPVLMTNLSSLGSQTPSSATHQASSSATPGSMTISSTVAPPPSPSSALKDRFIPNRAKFDAEFSYFRLERNENTENELESEKILTPGQRKLKEQLLNLKRADGKRLVECRSSLTPVFDRVEHFADQVKVS
jgi:hypothetical protein